MVLGGIFGFKAFQGIMIKKYMTAGGMPPVDLPPDDLKALIAYVQSLK